MPLALNETEEQYWITDEDLAYFAEEAGAGVIADAEPDTAYLVRYVSDQEQREVRQPFVEYSFDRKARKKIERPLSQEDMDEVSFQVFSRMLVDWRGVVNKKTGETLPCDDAFKRCLWKRKSRVLSMFHIVQELQGNVARNRGPESFRRPEGLGAVVG